MDLSNILTPAVAKPGSVVLGDLGKKLTVTGTTITQYDKGVGLAIEGSLWRRDDIGKLIAALQALQTAL